MGTRRPNAVWSDAEKDTLEKLVAREKGEGRVASQSTLFRLFLASGAKQTFNSFARRLRVIEAREGLSRSHLMGFATASGDDKSGLAFGARTKGKPVPFSDAEKAFITARLDQDPDTVFLAFEETFPGARSYTAVQNRLYLIRKAQPGRVKSSMELNNDRREAEALAKATVYLD